MSPHRLPLGCLRHTRLPTIFFLLLLLSALGVFHLLPTLLPDSPLLGQQYISMQNPSPAPCNTFYLIYWNTRVRLPYNLVFITLPPILYFVPAFPGSFCTRTRSPMSSAAPLHLLSYSPLCLACCLSATCFTFLWAKLSLLLS